MFIGNAIVQTLAAKEGHVTNIELRILRVAQIYIIFLRRRDALRKCYWIQLGIGEAFIMTMSGDRRQAYSRTCHDQHVKCSRNRNYTIVIVIFC